MSETNTQQNRYNNHQVRLLTPQDETLISSLITDKKDKVHPVETTLEGFAAARVGTAQDNKQCWVLLDDKQDLKAALYTYRDTTPIATEGNLSGDVHAILSTPVAPLERAARSVIFYSVASFDNGAGVHLINEVAAKFENINKFTMSTLSPLRGLGHWACANSKPCHKIRNQPEMLKSLALEFLMANEDKVQQFHMRNGAYIGDVKLEANKRGSQDDLHGMNVMVNYVYPEKSYRIDNSEAYKLNYLTLSWHLVGTCKKAGLITRRLPVGAKPFAFS